MKMKLTLDIQDKPCHSASMQFLKAREIGDFMADVLEVEEPVSYL
jgi:hypothetical protein